MRICQITNAFFFFFHFTMNSSLSRCIWEYQGQKIYKYKLDAFSMIRNMIATVPDVAELVQSIFVN